MTRPVLSSVVLAVLAATVPSAPAGRAADPASRPGVRIEATDRQTVTATITYEARAADVAVTRWTAFLPEPPELPSQVRVRVTADPPGVVVTERSPLARPVRFIDVPVRDPRLGGRLMLKLQVEATLRTRRLVPLGPQARPPAVPPLPAAEKTAYLAPDPHADYDAPAFRDWLTARRLKRVKGETAPELAARVLDVLRSDFTYAYDPGADRRASRVCGRTTADCGGLSVLVVSVMRANGIPARLLVGRTALPPQPGSRPGSLEYDRPHARAEFFVPGVGWVPVDPVVALAEPSRPATDFVGYDPGDLLVLHVGTDLQLPFPDQVRPAGLLQLAPSVWAFGRGKGTISLAPASWDLTATPR